MTLADLSDEELYRAAGVDNLARQKKRGAGVDKFADPANLADDELFAAAGISPGGSSPRPPIREYDMKGGKAVPRGAAPQLPPDAITAEELYALGSSPQTLRAELAGQHHPGAEPPHPPGEFDRIKQRWTRPVSRQIREIPEDLKRVGSLVNKGINSATLGGYDAARYFIGDLIAPEESAATRQLDARVQQEQPIASALASGAGYLSPVGPANMVGRSASAVGETAARFVPKLLERPVAGAVTGALGAGAAGAAEAASGGGSAGDVLEAAGRGAKLGGITGGAIGAVQGGLGRLAEGADRRISQRNIAELTDGASAARRDRVVGKGGQKYDRVDALARRTPDLNEAAGDPLKQKPVVQAQIDRTGAQLDEIYDGVMVRPQAITGPLREVAAEIRSKPHTSEQKAVADALDAEAGHIESTWSQYSKKGRPRPIQPESPYTEGTSAGVAPRDPTVRVSHDDMRGMGYRGRGFEPPAEQGYIDARDARQMITNYGKGLFRGNPNTPVNIPTDIKRKVYAKQVEALRGASEYFKPGVSEELNALNAEHSDWLNIADAVGARASRAATPGMTLKGQAHGILDTALGVMHPGHYLLKKGVEHYGPGALRLMDEQLSLGRVGLQGSNPLIRAYQSERERERYRAEMIKAGAEQKRLEQEELDRERAQMLAP